MAHRVTHPKHSTGAPGGTYRALDGMYSWRCGKCSAYGSFWHERRNAFNDYSKHWYSRHV